MITPEEARAQAEQNFHSGYTCAQAVLATFANELGISKETAMKTALPFGGGMCRMREVCGTVSGMLMALGFLEGSGNVSPKDEKDSVYAHGQALAEQFRKEHGSIVCRELLGLVPMGTSQQELSQAKHTGEKNGEVTANGLVASNTATTSANSTCCASGDTAAMTSPVSEARTETYYKKRPCEKLCGDAAEIFAKYLSEKK